MDSKNILYAIIATIVIYIGMQFKETYSVVSQTNKHFYASNHPYAVQQREKPHPSQVPKPTPVKKQGFQPRFVQIEGSIDPQMNYKIETIYEATLDTRSCKKRSYALFSPGIYPLSESFEYKPTRTMNSHKVKVPLDVFNPKEKCKFKLKYVRLIIQERTNPIGGTYLYLFANLDIINDIYQRFYKIAPPTKQADGKFHIDMECIDPSPFSQARYRPCGYKPLTKRNSILHLIPQQSANYVININKLPLEAIKGTKLDKIIGDDRGSYRRNYRYSKEAQQIKKQNTGKCGNTNRIMF